MPITEAVPEPSHTGTVAFRGWKTWYRVTGDLDAGDAMTKPLVVLHGGPGATHDYTLRIAVLAAQGRPPALWR